MRLRALVFAVVFIGAATPAHAYDLLANRGAETGDTSQWEAAGFGVERYGASALVPSISFAEAAPAFGHEPEAMYGEPGHGLETWLFTGSHPGASLTQLASLEPFATRIDEGNEAFALAGWFGGSAGSDATVIASLQFLDASRRPLGQPSEIGPTAADREGASTELRCILEPITAPSGSRWAEIVLRDTGSSGLGLADSVYFSNVELAEPASAPLGTPGSWGWEAKSDSECFALKPIHNSPAGPPGVISQSESQPPVVGSVAPKPRTSIIEGQVLDHSAGQAGWRVLLGAAGASLARHVMRTTSTRRYGMFRFVVHAGRYRLAAKAPRGRTCGAITVSIRAGHTLRPKLRCR